MTLIGRERELREIESLIAGARDSSGAALAILGDPGIGKTALLEEARGLAAEADVRILATAGVQSEASLAFAGLHQLLRPVLDKASDLPAPQRRALHAAFGTADEDGPDPFMIGLAALSLLADVGPVLVIADDTQWLDGATNAVLGFIARRIAADPIALLLATREGVESPVTRDGVAKVTLGPLPAPSARELLHAAAPDLTDEQRTRVLGQAAGNPLALIELPGALREALEAGGGPLPDVIPLTARLEASFLARAAGLTEATRKLLLVAAADDSGSIADVLAAAALLGEEDHVASAFDQASAANLVEVDGNQIRFRHPLVRSAIYGSAHSPARFEVHAALARVVADPDRRAWHTAASILGTNDDAANALDASASRSRRRGAIPVAIAALERAAALSSSDSTRAHRLLGAAELAFELGAHAALLRLLRQAESLDLDARDRPRLAWLREWYAQGSWSGTERVPAFVAIADQIAADGDPAYALSCLMTVALRTYWSNPDEATRALLTGAAERMPVPPAQPELLAVLAFAAPLERGALVLERLEALDTGPVVDAEHLRLLGTAATGIGAWPRASALLLPAVAGLRREGRLGLIAYAQTSLAWAGIFTGDWNRARAAAHEAIELNRESSRPIWLAAALAAAATLEGLRSRTAEAEELAGQAAGLLVPMGANPLLALVQVARGVAALGADAHEAAYDHLRRVFDESDIAYHRYVRHWIVTDLIDAAVRVGRVEEIRNVVGRLEDEAEMTRSPLLLASLRFARPLLASDDAERRFAEGLEADLSGWPFIRARLLLAYGEWLRRRRRLAEARAPLRVARDSFDALGASAWGERARVELRAAGEVSRQRQVGGVEHLTPQEFQIAQLAAQGLSNREIADQLYLSHRTVAFHLYRLFPKLGITSRGQLHDALARLPASEDGQS
jgi:DNA-binding CsgD family transcriptional regulator